MKRNSTLKDLGEVNLIQLIVDVIFKKTGKSLVRDDSYLYDLPLKINSGMLTSNVLVIHTDMLVSTTDVPSQMSYYQIGRKSIVMNVSDVIVKGVKPKGVVISLGLPGELEVGKFKELIEGIVDYCVKYDLDYIGGDLSQTQEIIVNPTVFGFRDRTRIVRRSGVKPKDIIVANGKFGLTGVGFDILLKRKGKINEFPKYMRSIKSVLEPEISSIEAYALTENRFRLASIDSSDGLSKSIKDLAISNPEVGFEVDFTEEIYDEEARLYSEEFNTSLEDLVLNAGEEYIHLFVVSPKDYENAKSAVEKQGGKLYKVGKITTDKKCVLTKAGKKTDLSSSGYEHFR